MVTEQSTHIDIQTAIEDFEKRYPDEMGVLRIGGVYPGEVEEGFVNPYTGEPDHEYFGNIGEHCVAVAYCADVLAHAFLDPEDSGEDIVRSALVHDATKRFEVMRRKAARKGTIIDAYSQGAYDTIRPLLEEQGVPADTIEYMARAGSETGHNSLPGFVRLHDGEPVLITEGNLADRIVHLADDMTYTPIVPAGEEVQTTYVTMPERMEAANFPERYPFLYSEGFGFDKDGNLVLVKDTTTENSDLVQVGTYAQWLIWVAREISIDLARRISHDISEDEAEQCLVDMVNATL